jgi:hypothetical protein
MKPYYYVYRYGHGMPTVRHATLKEAQAEAERLAKRHQGFQFEILEFKGISSFHDSITFWVDGSGPEQQVNPELTNEPESKQIWETFCDASYYDMWRVRRKTERGWGDGLHLADGLEAKALCSLLNQLENQ